MMISGGLLRRLSNQQDSSSLGGHCFGLFIDGLDEYQATASVDRREMVRSLVDLANSASGSFKICVSSRMRIHSWICSRIIPGSIFTS